MLTHNRCSIALRSPSPSLVTRLQSEESEVACIESRGSPHTVPEEELLPEALTPGMVPHSWAALCQAHDYFQVEESLPSPILPGHN